MDDTEWVRVAEFTTTDEYEADMTVARLRNADIQARRVPPTSVGGLIPNLRLPVAILVRKDQAARAREILDESEWVQIAETSGHDAEDRAAEIIARLLQAGIEYMRVPMTPAETPGEAYTVRLMVRTDDENAARRMVDEME
ncbi:MAG: putative signal transducing protein [Armatimonadota bacterium]